MRLLISILLLCLILFATGSAYSWSNNGHRIIAAIAYQHLQPSAKREVNRLTKVMFHSRSGWVRFILASTWADRIKFDDVTAFNAWHYIDSPYSTDGTVTQPIAKQNVAWAIQQSVKVLENPQSNRMQKARVLNFLIHFVGDAHQPLHCIDVYSKTYPHGDEGGNLFLIKSPIAVNLHEFWDRSAGLFRQRNHSRFRQVDIWAEQVENQYPKSYFHKRSQQLDPWVWTKHGYQLAIQYAYANIQPNRVPSANYVKLAQQISKQQLALAGYRLANILNVIFSHGGIYQ